MKKTSLLMILAAFAVHSFGSWASDTPTEILEDLDKIKERVRALQASNEAKAEELERAKLMEQLRAEEAKAADLEQQKNQLAEEASLPKTWEGIPYMEVKVAAWRQYFSQIESTFDPRKSSNSLISETSKLLAKNGGKKFKPAVSQINSSHTHVLQSHPNQWSSLGLNEDTQTHLNIARFLLDKIWLQSYQGKVGFKL